MLKIILKYFIIVITISSISYAQTTDETFRSIEQAIIKADMQALSKYMDEEVEVTIDKTEQSYAKAQATFVIREFFMNYPVRSFRILHKGQAGDTYYAVGEYLTARGNTPKYDTNIFIKKINGKYLIEQIRFEKE